ncbi:MAG: hypothetical protein ACUVV0_00650 [Anaerolineae bacterium]
MRKAFFIAMGLALFFVLLLAEKQAAFSQGARFVLAESEGGKPAPDLFLQQTPITVYSYYTMTDNFEGPFIGGLTRDVAYAWTPFISWGPPTMDREYTNRHGGSWAQKISGHAEFRAGIYRNFGTLKGAPYEAHVFVQLYPKGSGLIRIGIDPTGDTNPDSPNVIWTGTWAREKDIWTELVNSGVAQANSITVFLDVYNPEPYNTNGYFDDFEVKIGRGFYLATPTPAPSPTPTPTFPVPVPSMTPGYQPLLAVYDPSLDKSLVEIVNTTAQPLTILLGEAISFTVAAGGRQTQEVEPGTYHYTASVYGLPPASGALTFERHHRYTWTFWVSPMPTGTPTMPPMLPTETPTPSPTLLPSPTPSATPVQPFVAVYEPGLTKPIVEIVNGTGRELTISLGTEVITVPLGGRTQREVEPGTYPYTASVPGLTPTSGVVIFKSQYRYTWNFWIANP